MATMIAWTTEGWSRDVTTDIAGEVRRSYAETNERSESLLALLETNRGQEASTCATIFVVGHPCP